MPDAAHVNTEGDIETGNDWLGQVQHHAATVNKCDIQIYALKGPPPDRLGDRLGEGEPHRGDPRLRPGVRPRQWRSSPKKGWPLYR